MGHGERAESIRESGGSQPAARPRIVLSGGYTAGHVYPALAVAEAFERLLPGAEVVFVGTADGVESRLVPKSGYAFEAVPAAPLVDRGAGGKARAVSSLMRGTRRARQLLRRLDADLVIGFGAFVSAAAVLAGRTLGLRTAIHEANVVPGLANRLLGRVVDRVYLGDPAARPSFPAGPCVVVGTPIRREIAALAGATPAPPSADRAARLFVTGGSGGSAFLDRAAPELVAELAADGVALEVRHQVGSGDVDAVRRQYEAAGIPAAVGAYVDDMAAAYGWADLAICRAGAGTLAELAAAGLPALLVPLPGLAGDHQTLNARAFAEAGCALWVSHDDFDPAAQAERVGALLRDAASWSAIATAVRGRAAPAAADALVQDCAVFLRRP